MSLFVRTLVTTAFAGALLAGLSACQYRPLYGANSYAPDGSATDKSAYVLSRIRVADVDTRVAQQVRNRLIFLLQGGRPAPKPNYELRLRTGDTSRLHAATRSVRDNTAGVVTVTVSYDLIDLSNYTHIAAGNRVASASFDRTGQSFANERAIIDAENRAAGEVAEELRLALAAELTRN